MGLLDLGSPIVHFIGGNDYAESIPYGGFNYFLRCVNIFGNKMFMKGSDAE